MRRDVLAHEHERQLFLLPGVAHIKLQQIDVEVQDALPPQTLPFFFF